MNLCPTVNNTIPQKAYKCTQFLYAQEIVSIYHIKNHKKVSTESWKMSQSSVIGDMHIIPA